MIHVAIALLKTFGWLGLGLGTIAALWIGLAGLGTGNGYVIGNALGLASAIFFSAALGWAILIVLAHIAERVLPHP